MSDAEMIADALSPDAALDYLGVKPCGCAVAWVSSRAPAKDAAKLVAKMIRDGLDVQRVTTEESWQRVRRCVHKVQASAQEELAV